MPIFYRVFHCSKKRNLGEFWTNLSKVYVLFCQENFAGDTVKPLPGFRLAYMRNKKTYECINTYIWIRFIS